MPLSLRPPYLLAVAGLFLAFLGSGRAQSGTAQLKDLFAVTRLVVEVANQQAIEIDAIEVRAGSEGLAEVDFTSLELPLWKATPILMMAAGPTDLHRIEGTKKGRQVHFPLKVGAPMGHKVTQNLGQWVKILDIPHLRRRRLEIRQVEDAPARIHLGATLPTDLARPLYARWLQEVGPGGVAKLRLETPQAGEVRLEIEAELEPAPAPAPGLPQIFESFSKFAKFASSSNFSGLKACRETDDSKVLFQP